MIKLIRKFLYRKVSVLLIIIIIPLFMCPKKFSNVYIKQMSNTELCFLTEIKRKKKGKMMFKYNFNH